MLLAGLGLIVFTARRKRLLLDKIRVRNYRGVRSHSHRAGLLPESSNFNLTSPLVSGLLQRLTRIYALVDLT